MRAVVMSGPGGPEVLSLGSVPAPAPAADEVLIDVVATAVNRADLMQRAGHYPPPPGASAILGLECSGRISFLGKAVTGWSLGQPVCALLTGGGYAAQVAVPAGQLMPVPAGVDLVSAAALPEVSCTVWSMVFQHSRLRAGERFLVHGGSSGIGTMAIQLAHAHGARVYATAGGPAKLDACRGLGADLAINYREADFAAVIEEETDGAGVNVILDTIGAKYLARNVDSLATSGRLAVIGLMGGRVAELDLAKLMTKRASIYAATLRTRPAAEKAEIVAGTQAHVWPLVADGSVRPIVHEVLDLQEASRAHEIVGQSSHVGKIILRVGG